MSQPSEIEIDERLWDYYLLDCRANGVKPDLSDFMVWQQEQDFDLDPPELPEREEPDLD